MTDNEIISTLQHHKDLLCTDCPLQGTYTSCLSKICTEALRLILRLQERIEHLERANSLSQGLLSDSWKTIEQKDQLLESHSSVPYPCGSCPNHPSNGGSGICNCTLGGEPIVC